MKKFMNVIIVFMGLLLIGNNSMGQTFKDKVKAAASPDALLLLAPDAYDVTQQELIEIRAKELQPNAARLASLLSRLRPLYGTGGKAEVGPAPAPAPAPAPTDIAEFRRESAAFSAAREKYIKDVQASSLDYADKHGAIQDATVMPR